VRWARTGAGVSVGADVFTVRGRGAVVAGRRSGQIFTVRGRGALAAGRRRLGPTSSMPVAGARSQWGGGGRVPQRRGRRRRRRGPLRSGGGLEEAECRCRRGGWGSGSERVGPARRRAAPRQATRTARAKAQGRRSASVAGSLLRRARGARPPRGRHRGRRGLGRGGAASAAGSLLRLHRLLLFHTRRASCGARASSCVGGLRFRAREREREIARGAGSCEVCSSSAERERGGG
jgi:hypothetical protein